MDLRSPAIYSKGYTSIAHQWRPYCHPRLRTERERERLDNSPLHSFAYTPAAVALRLARSFFLGGGAAACVLVSCPLSSPFLPSSVRFFVFFLFETPAAERSRCPGSCLMRTTPLAPPPPPRECEKDGSLRPVELSLAFSILFPFLAVRLPRSVKKPSSPTPVKGGLPLFLARSLFAGGSPFFFSLSRGVSVLLHLRLSCS